jgi:hypothetical protein
MADPYNVSVMRKAFRHYFRLTKDELDALWKTALFSFDASVLLNIYGYSNEARDDLVNSSSRMPIAFCCPISLPSNMFAVDIARS